MLLAPRWQSFWMNCLHALLGCFPTAKWDRYNYLKSHDKWPIREGVPTDGAVKIDQSELRNYEMIPVYFHIHSATIFGVACHRMEGAFDHSSENGQFKEKDPSSSWISTQSDILCCITRKTCTCLMFRRFLNAILQLNRRCCCCSILGRYVKRGQECAP